MEQFKKNFSFDMEEDDTIVKNNEEDLIAFQKNKKSAIKDKLKAKQTDKNQDNGSGKNKNSWKEYDSDEDDKNT